MSGGDWMSMLGYGQGVIVPNNTVAVVPLMTMPDLAAYDASLPEGGPALQAVRDLSIQRIVGQVFRRYIDGVDADAIWGWRLLALPWDFTNNVFDVPWDAGDPVMTDPDLTDIVRWWAERFYVEDGTNVFGGLTPLFHPWWTQVDIEPKALVGMHTGVWPGLLIDNTYNERNLTVIHRLRSYGYQR